MSTIPADCPPHTPGSPAGLRRALFLDERRQLLADQPEPSPEKRQEAERRAEEWQRSMLVEGELFTERLRGSNLDRASFVELLARHAPETDAGDGSAWRAILQEIMEDRHRGQGLLTRQTESSSPGTTRRVTGSFRGFFEPILRTGAARLRAGLAELADRRGLDKEPLTPEGEAGMLGALARRLSMCATPTLILELNVARMEGRLEGALPEERFEHFSEVVLARPQIRRALFDEYPVLGRLIATLVEFWVEAMLEPVERFLDDREEIGREILGEPEPPRKITGVEASLSDSHRRGRGVLVLQLEGAERVVYKPRGLGVDARFQDLLLRLNAWGLRHPQRPLRLLDRGEYGWVEFAQHRSCGTGDAVERFFWRQGSYLALLHLLRAVDVHYENLIASGENPILVDLEALFHQRLSRSDDGTARLVAQRWLNDSVVGIGMLPVLTWAPDGKAGADLSGIGARGGGEFPFDSWMPVEPETDVMRLERQTVIMKEGRNRPMLGDRDVDPAGFLDQIVEGFRETYDLMMANREHLAVALESFAGLELRYIARPTASYGLFLQQGIHPDHLRDGLDRDRLFDKLWAQVGSRPDLAPLVPSEHADLLQGDVPLFTVKTSERHVWDSRGRRIEDYFLEDGLSIALGRLRELSSERREEQVKLIRESMLLVDSPRARMAQPAPTREPERILAPGSQEYLEGAIRVGDRLRNEAILGRDDVSWISLTLRSEGTWDWALKPVDANLYDGLAGLSLFFAHLAQACGRDDFDHLARRATRPLLARLEMELPAGTGTIGGFVGLPSALYALAHLARLWDDEDLLGRAVESVPRIAQHVDADDGLDLLSGAAGCCIIALGLYELTGDHRLIELAAACGEHLLETASRMPTGLGWIPAAASKALAGFSHGSTGIALALHRLHAETGDERFRRAASDALAYERSLFDPTTRNWADLRRFPEAEARGFKSVAWCHGPPGIALGRMLMLPHVDGERARREIVIAMEETTANGFGGNQSLCHGDLGNADIMFTVGEALDQESWRTTAVRHASRACEDVRNGRLRTGLPRSFESPGLMLGLAGIGYGLLRFWSRATVPGVLWLEGPR